MADILGLGLSHYPPLCLPDAAGQLDPGKGTGSEELARRDARRMGR
jgi:hypothetical protein